jgi:alpha-tubulin suppressor-like RCC1 family protein
LSKDEDKYKRVKRGGAAMKNKKMYLLVLVSMVLVFSLILPASAAGASETVPLPDDYSIIHSTLDGSDLASTMTLNTPDGDVTPMVAAGWAHMVGLRADGAVLAAGYGWPPVLGWADITQVAAGGWHTVGLKSDGTVVAAGWNLLDQCEVSDWTDITYVAAGHEHTVGLKSDHTVVAVGLNDYGQCEVGNWTDIIQVAGGWHHTVGVKSDHTVVAVGLNDLGQCNVGNWTDIIQVAAFIDHTVGLRDDGTVVAVGANWYGKCDVGGWTDITQVAAGHYHTVGLESDGTVVAVGDNSDGKCDVGGWTDITQVAAGLGVTLGLKADGTVVTAGVIYYGQCEVSGWTDIDQVAAGAYHTLGLKSDRTVVPVGANYLGQCNVGGWTDIDQLAAGFGHTVGLETDDTVVAVGLNHVGQCDVGGWSNITQVAAGDIHTVGRKDDGTVVAVGANWYGECDVGSWTDITQVAAGDWYTVGRKDDGTVVATGYNGLGQCNVLGWRNISQVAAGGSHTVGRKSDGTVVAVGYSLLGQCQVGDWTGINQTAAGSSHTVGLKSDGTVVAVGSNYHGQCNVGNWTDITQIAADGAHTVGLRSDGTVVAVGAEVELPEWNLRQTPDIMYTVIIFSTPGGSVIVPGERAFTFDEGTVLNLVAVAEEGYRFVCWTGIVDSIDDVYAAQTTITMNANYSITARFTAVVDSKTETVSNGTVDAKEQADTEVEVTGNATVTVSQFEDNPGGYSPTGFNSLDKYIDVYIPYTGDVTETEIRLYYTDDEVPAGVDEEDLKLFWWDGDEWVQCSNSGVNTASNYIWAIITDSTTPSLDDLEGTPFSGGAPVVPTVTTKAATEVRVYGANLNMDYTVGVFSPVQVRFAYKKSAGTGWSYTDWVSKEADGTYAKSVSSLDSNTQYEFKAQLKYNDTVIAGTTIQFTTQYTTETEPTRRYSSGNCFIATAAYGTPMAGEIEILREFRDEYMLTNPLGRAFVDFYYKVSPPIAEFITEHPSLKPIVRTGLLPFVAMSTVVVNTTPVEKAIIIGLMVLVSAAMAIWVIRRRGRGPEYT